MPKVFVPQQPSRYDTATQLWVPTVNIAPANRFGDVVVMLPPNANRMYTAPLVDVIKRRMDHFTRDDYVVALGDPSLIAVAACVAASKTNGTFKMLKWDKVASDYISVEIEI